MATFQVPQFIEEKPKIVGFLTLPQFLYLAGAGLLSFIAFNIFSFFLWIIVTVLFGTLGIALAFVKLNGQDMPHLMLAAGSFFWKPHMYTWQRASSETVFDLGDVERVQELRSTISIQEKLKSVALGITTGKLFQGNHEPQKGVARAEVVTFLTGERKVAKRIDY